MNELFNTIGELNTNLKGLPGGSLVFLGCLFIGYAVKVCPWVSNRWIPSIVILSGPFLYFGLEENLHGRVAWFQTGVIGFILGCLAVLSHHFIWSRIESYFCSKFGPLDRLLNPGKYRESGD